MASISCVNQAMMMWNNSKIQCKQTKAKDLHMNSNISHPIYRDQNLRMFWSVTNLSTWWAMGKNIITIFVSIPFNIDITKFISYHYWRRKCIPRTNGNENFYGIIFIVSQILCLCFNTNGEINW